MTPPPTSVRVGPLDFEVVVVNGDELEDHFGDMHPDSLRIRLMEGIAPGLERETLMHELMHAAYYASGLREYETEHEEREVTALALALLAMLRNNPELVAYLTADGQ